MSRILIVDDDEQLRTMLRMVLQGAGYEVLEARDGRLIGKALEEHPDLIVTDVLMPGTDGFEVIRELRRNDPSVRIIAMSGGGRLSGESYLNIAEKLGAKVTLAKPFSKTEFLEAVRMALAS